MSDDIFGKVGNELSENAISGMVEEELRSHKKEDASLPIIKLKLAPTTESVVDVAKRKEKRENPQVSGFKSLSSSNLAKVNLVNVIKLPDTLSQTQKLKKVYRYRRYGMQMCDVPSLRRESKPLPDRRKQDFGKLRRYRVQKKSLGMGLIMPALIIFLSFSWMPIFKTFSIAFQKFQTINSAEYVGLSNFLNILTDAKFWDACIHSGILSAIVIVLGTWLPLFLALYIYEARHGSSLMKVLYFIPFLTPAVPAAILWKWMYNQGFGVINSILSLFTQGHQVTIGWLTNPHLVLLSISIVFIWKNTGWAMLIYMAGLQNIPKNLFEDAALNGASVASKIKNIILPSLVQVIMAVVFIQIINGMQVFSEVYIMTNGGPVGSSEVIATYMYKKAFLYMDIGYASGVAVFFLFLLVTITLFRMNLSNARKAVK
jgi:ABC-type sugar transport system permease subunit